MAASSRHAEHDEQIAARLKALRVDRGLTLDALAERSGVSRAMMSRIERGESSPTVGLLARLCEGLGTTLSAVLGGGADPPPTSIARRADQPLWRDPASGYLRLAVSPAGPDWGVEIVEIELQVGAAVLFDAPDRTGHDRYIWVLRGRVEIARDGDTLVLDSGDCLRAAVAGPTGFRNAGPTTARYAVITGRTERDGRARRA